MIDKVQLDRIIGKDFPNFQEVPSEELSKFRSPSFAYRGNVSLVGKSITLGVGIPKGFPTTKPTFFILPYDALGFIPHVDPDGYICYIQEDNLNLDYNNPEGILSFGIERVKEVLEQGFTAENENDFLNEFSSYWQHNVKCLSGAFINTCSISQTPKKVQMGVTDLLRVFSDSSSLKEVNENICGRFGLRKVKKWDFATYLPIKKETLKCPPKFEEFWSLQEIQELISQNYSQEELSELLHSKPRKDEYVLLGISDYLGNVHLVGVRVRNKSNYYESAFYSKNYKAFDAAPFYLIRLEKESLLPRSGGKIELAEKRVLIIGGGSVGAPIALNLARAGVGKMTICDPESFSHENIYRHPLGVSYLNVNKAEALKSSIEALIPFCRITSIPEKVECIGIHEFGKFDLVVFATGDPTVNRFVSEQIRKEGISTSLIYAWNEPYGLGGHALLTHSLGKGCYSCLYNDDLHNRASFCSEFQPKSFVKSLAGCIGNFVPFGYLDSTKTAELASRLAIDSLIGGFKNPQIKSWKGDSKQFLEEGYNLSERYTSFSEEELLSGTAPFTNHECQNCSTPLK